MNKRHLGDSFDIVKRFFCETVKGLGYEMFIDPMFTDAWGEEVSAFYTFLGVKHVREWSSGKCPTALFLDPDTGVDEKGKRGHVSFDRLASELHTHMLVFTFDQSFSRQVAPPTCMTQKLEAMRDRGCQGLYYDSQAKFLFVAREACRLAALKQRLHELGLPASRLVQSDACRCCQKGFASKPPRICPECGHRFKGNGWDGIDAHWRSKHKDVMPYEQFWNSLCSKHKG